METSAESVFTMKVADLKRELKLRGLLTTGNKNELVDRLHTCLLGTSTNDDVNEDEVLADDSLLNDEGKASDILTDDDILDGKEDITLGITHTTLLGLEPANPLLGTSKTENPKVLKRLPVNLSSSTPNTNENVKTKRPIIVLDSSNGNTAKNPIKITTEEEKMISRAKRFNLTAPQTKLLVRSQRFGLDKTTKTDDVIKGQPTSVDLGKLKSRAERFGQSVSKMMKEAENKDQLLKRKERFGSVLPSSIGVHPDEQEKKKQRTARFGTAAI